MESTALTYLVEVVTTIFTTIIDLGADLIAFIMTPANVICLIPVALFVMIAVIGVITRLWK